MPPKRIDHAVRDMVYAMLMKYEEHPLTRERAWERACNIATAMVGNFDVRPAIDDQRPDPAGDDDLIVTTGGRP